HLPDGGDMGEAVDQPTLPLDSPAMSGAPTPTTAAMVAGWLGELGLKPVESAEREDMGSWDLLLDGKKRLAIRFTVIHQPALGAVVWVHYAPPLADSLRKTYR